MNLGRVDHSSAPGPRVGPYELLGALGRGNLGTVYLARNPSLDVEVALKLFDPEAVTMMPRDTALRVFEAQARLAQRLIHGAITGVLGVAADEEVPYLVMQRVYNGRSLARYCEASERLPLEDVVRIVRACALALDFAHDHGVIHRDVKPRNILLEVGLEPKLVDFGFSILVDGQGEVSPRYQSPEQIRQKLVGPQTDLFNLGVILYELIAGRHPFEAPTYAEQLERTVSARHVRIRKLRSDIPQELQTITNRCLAKRAGNRYPSAAHLAADLEVVLDVMAAASKGTARQRAYDKVRALETFASFSTQELNETLHHCTMHKFRPGDEVIAVGDEAACVYIVVEGEVGVRREEAFEIVHLGEGECVGEVGALTKMPRTATVIALDRCTLLSVPMAFLDQGPAACQLHLKNLFLRSMAQRMADALGSVC